jgi:hypothetical protein
VSKDKTGNDHEKEYTDMALIDDRDMNSIQADRPCSQCEFGVKHQHQNRRERSQMIKSVNIAGILALHGSRNFQLVKDHPPSGVRAPANSRASGFRCRVKLSGSAVA